MRCEAEDDGEAVTLAQQTANAFAGDKAHCFDAAMAERERGVDQPAITASMNGN